MTFFCKQVFDRSLRYRMVGITNTLLYAVILLSGVFFIYANADKHSYGNASQKNTS